MRLNFKRMALLSGKAARALSGLVKLTPARIDLMVAVLHWERSQSELATVLCVHPSVVCRIVRALLHLGLVSRRIPPEDRRLRLVRLTAEGEARLAPCIGSSPLLPADGSRNAQCAGEGAWLLDWNRPLARMRVRIGTLVRSVYPPLFYMRIRNRQNPYRSWFSGRCPAPLR